MIKQLVTTHRLGQRYQQAVIGIEKESQRITDNGQLATSEHPPRFGKRHFHPYIQTDFAESQLELVTPPVASVQEVLRWLSAIHEVVWRTIPSDELIWPLSMPPALPDESRISVARLENAADVAYREYLVSVYGKKKQMVCGIHYNFELDAGLLQAAFAQQTTYATFQAFQTEVYMKLARNFLRYQWLLVYLIGAAPEVDASYFNGSVPLPTGQKVRSLRSSQYGYVNAPEVAVSFRSLSEYAASLQQMVATGLLSEEKEFYATVRFRGGKNAEELLHNGIRYLEFRLFDLDPFEANGISEQTAQLIHQFLLTLLWIDDAGADGVAIGKQRMNEVALEAPDQPTAYMQEGLWLCEQMENMLETIEAPETWHQALGAARQALQDPRLTLAARVVAASAQCGGYQQFGLQRAEQCRQEALAQPYGLRAFAEMELSTQALLVDAIRLGIHTTILDESDQFLLLSYQGHQEYVKNGNMTRCDTYIAPLIMENKVVTKKVLQRAGFRVPDSREYRSVAAALADVGRYVHQAIVVKPKSTNYGLGITIFQEGLNNATDFETAVRLAFQEDDEIMVETYLPGTEYRFFVIDSQTKAVLLRVPANVVGDGQQTVAQLVAQKNDDPLRGDGNRTPLKKIALGPLELLQLKSQGYTPDSVPAAGVTVQLRANSNISTGGDSIDQTDVVHESYKQLAARIAEALTAKICGVDLIIPDCLLPVEAQPDTYGIIEANFNPMMMMHLFPYQGTSRRLTVDVLRLLFPEYGSMSE